MSGRGSTKSERYQPTTNTKPSETMFQRVLLDFVLSFGLGAENEAQTRDPGIDMPLSLFLLGQGCALPTATNKKKTTDWLSFKSGKRGSNSRPQPWQGCALPTELFPRLLRKLEIFCCARCVKINFPTRWQRKFRIYLSNSQFLLRSLRENKFPHSLATKIPHLQLL